MSNLTHQLLAENAADIVLCDLCTLDPTIAQRFGRRLRDQRAGLIRVWSAMLTSAGEAERLRPLVSGLLNGFRLRGANVDDQAMFGMALVRVLRSVVGRQRTGGGCGMGDLAVGDGAGVDHDGGGLRVKHQSASVASGR